MVSYVSHLLRAAGTLAKISVRVFGERGGVAQRLVVQLLDLVVLGAQLREDAALAGQMPGADRDKNRLRRLQKRLDLLRHGVVALIEHLLEQRL